MRKLLSILLHGFLRFTLSLRYRIEVKGLETLTPETLSKKGGILFLPNHPALIDPCILFSIFWKRFQFHPIAIDFLFQRPILRRLLEFIGALPVPNFEDYTNSFKLKQIEETYETLFSLLRNRENLLIYPAGGLKRQAEELVGGSSGVHKILQAAPEANVVLIRTTGLWGSSFSKALLGRTPDLGQAFTNGFKILLKNLIFFTPRRRVLVECMPAPPDFPWKESRLELNRYLEQWYNAQGLEPLTRVSYSFWKEELPEIQAKPEGEELPIEKVPSEIKARVAQELAELARVDASHIKPTQILATDLGLDSLDQAQIVAFLKDQFGVANIHGSDLKSVAHVMVFAAKLTKGKTVEEEGTGELTAWHEEKGRPLAQPPEGKSLIEAFLLTSERMDGYLACVDAVSGELSYHKLKLAAIILAKEIAHLPGKHVGIMMPASCGVNIVILATMLAGKIPVMINWTLGPHNLQSVVQQSGVETVISSWNFLNRLDNVDLDGVDDKILLIEDIRREIRSIDKLRGLRLARKKTKALLKHFGIANLKESDTAVILFTSGTESQPKGVPLSHGNILSNQRDGYQYVDVRDQDVLLGVLPPFHSFGFSVTGLFPIVTGLRVAFFPNPTDGRRMALTIDRWHATIICMAPSFLKNLLRVASSEQLKTIRLVVSGAERTPEEIYQKMKELNPQAQVIEGYGITECAPILTLNPPKRERKGVGMALPQVELLVVNPEDHQKLPPNKEGMILARGPNVFSGYLDPSLKSPFVALEGKNWYQTGDLGHLDEKGYLTLSGRLKRFVKIGGEMVSLTLIEEVLQEAGKAKNWKIDPEAPSLAVCALEEGGKKSEIHLFTTFPASLDEVNQELRNKGMSNLIRITAIKQVPFIPLLGTGKIDYRTLTTKLKTS